mmetsp:Transcript_8427/g.24204  ORF Transcript_8427/g.24204 Transcript_8427/m.24204 type:complete len:101 (-) Transcript_8427:763-1065(-)
MMRCVTNTSSWLSFLDFGFFRFSLTYVLAVRGDRVFGAASGSSDVRASAWSNADLPLPGDPSISARTSLEGSKDSVGSFGATADFFLALLLFLLRFGSSM